MKKLALILLALVVIAGGWLGWQLNSRPSLARYEALAYPASPSGREGLEVIFMGVSTLLLRDSSAAVLVDGFFTRPGLLQTAFGKLAPDPIRIQEALELAGVSRLDAVIPVHSHYDHAMDTPLVAEKTGALVVGSTTTANIARGQGTPEERLRIVTSTETMTFGDLKVTLIPSKHFPHGQAMGELTEPLVPPARATDYLEGGSFSVLVERGSRAVLVQGSAGYVEGALAGRRADVVFLGVGLLGSKDAAYREAYWRETVTAVGAKRVVPIHWDDFTRTLKTPLAPLPYLLDNLDTSMDFVLARSAQDQVDVSWPVLWRRADPFHDLP